MAPSRRALLAAGAALPGLALPGLAFPRPARAASASASAVAAPAERKLLVVTNFGGWDPTRTLVDLLAAPGVATEAQAASATTAGLSWVDHPERPSVAAFMARWAERLALVHGLLVPSVAHGSCLELVRTGRSAAGLADFMSIFAAAHDHRPLPHLVLSGRAFPGDRAGAVARVGSSGQLAALLSGEILAWADSPLAAPSTTPSTASTYVQQALQARLARREAAAGDLARPSLQRFAASLGRAEQLLAVQDQLDWSTGEALLDQVDLAVDVLALGLSRVVSLDSGIFWDTHDLNDVYQSWYWELLFEGLDQLVQRLSDTPGEAGASLLDETTVLVVSEMARSPGLNANQGKDHWPWTSAMLLGAGVRGGVTVGGYDDGQLGLPVDPTSGAVLAAGSEPLCVDLGATLLALGDVDPALAGEGGRVLEALLA